MFKPDCVPMPVALSVPMPVASPVLPVLPLPLPLPVTVTRHMYKCGGSRARRAIASAAVSYRCS